MKYHLQNASLPAFQMLALLTRRREELAELVLYPLDFSKLSVEQLLDLKTIAAFDLALSRSIAMMFDDDPFRDIRVDTALQNALARLHPSPVELLDQARWVGVDIVHRLKHGEITNHEYVNRESYLAVYNAVETRKVAA
ncbi:hypothetical protein ACCS79_03705 [Rhizobium johnstonii]|uniref:hypothetical protein n=1 Tax=Rhizobium johnstonii TaxID=3019933 RepID=UPI003F9CC9E2